MRYEMDNLGGGGGLKGVGYLRVRNKKLPARDKGSSRYDVLKFLHPPLTICNICKLTVLGLSLNSIASDLIG